MLLSFFLYITMSNAWNNHSNVLQHTEQPSSYLPTNSSVRIFVDFILDLKSEFTSGGEHERAGPLPLAPRSEEKNLTNYLCFCDN